MWRFLLRQNIDRYRNLLRGEQDREKRGVLEALLSEAEAESAELEALSTAALAKYDSYLQLFAQRAVDDAVAFLNAQFGHLQIYDPASSSLVMVAHRNFRAPFLNHFARVTIGDGSAPARALASRERAIIKDVTLDGAYAPHRDIARVTGCRMVLSTPLLHEDLRVLGTLSTFFDTPRHLSNEELAHVDQHAEAVASHFRAAQLAA